MTTSPPPDVPPFLRGDFDPADLPEGPECEALLMEELGRVTALIDSAEQYRMWLLRLYDEHGVQWANVPDTESYLPLRLGMTQATARRTMKVARKLAEFPEIDAQFAQGQLSRDKVEQIVRVATPTNQDTLIRLAQSWDGEKTRRVVAVTIKARAAEKRRELDPDKDPRKLFWRDLETGLERVTAELYPEEAALVRTMIEEGLHRAEREAPRPGDDPSPPTGEGYGGWDPDASAASNAGRTRPRLRDVHGLVHAAGEYLAWAGDGREAQHPGRFEVQLIVQANEAEAGLQGDAAAGDVSAGGGGRDSSSGPVSAGGGGRDPSSGPAAGPQVSLRGGLLDRSRAPLPSDVLSRILCDCPTVELVETPDGKLDLGRRTRRISPALRRALNIRDPFCRWPGCYRKTCHAHHQLPWYAGGATKLSNLVNLCEHHHRIVHEAGWSIAFRDGRWVALGPQGEFRQGVARPPPIPPDAREALRRHAAARGVFVDWDSAMPTHGCDEIDFDLLEIAQMLYEALAEDEGLAWPYDDACRDDPDGPEETASRDG